MINEKYKYSDLTSKIIGLAMEVHRQLGNGFTHYVNIFFNGIRDCFAIQEVIYQRALEIEFRNNDISFSREHEMPVYYKEQQIGLRRVDFLVGNIISLELKAIIELQEVHLAQAINYLEAYDLEVGLLINFGAKSLQFKRLSNKSFKQQNQGNPKINKKS
ncbi:GxxExxY protein [uncultured Polaribacter sp.]|uniref:GxxExxY protein n=1 Tax=uncultured Polaribacter sp. TaxID=174711 RepID=UPI00260B1BDF|nr:GxxExxY protein [uncultured Polaribacter sp.]